MAVRQRRLTRLAMLVALGAILGLLERQFPPPVPVPGIRLGLANVATLVALAVDGPAGAGLVWGLRAVLVGLLSGGIFGPGFLVGATGGFFAWVSMAGVSRFGSRSPLGAAGISVTGAIAHHLGQLVAAAALTRSGAVLYLLPALVASAAPVGFLTGLTVDVLLGRLRQVLALAPWAGGNGRPRLLDWGVAAAATALAISLWLVDPAGIHRGKGQATHAEVNVAGRTMLKLDLRETATYPLKAGTGNMVIQVQDGAIRVLESDCPDKVCVLTGWVRNPGGIIVCAPYRTVVRLTGGSDPDAPDAILR